MLAEFRVYLNGEARASRVKSAGAQRLIIGIGQVRELEGGLGDGARMQ